MATASAASSDVVGTADEDVLAAYEQVRPNSTLRMVQRTETVDSNSDSDSTSESSRSPNHPQADEPFQAVKRAPPWMVSIQTAHVS